MAIVVTTTGEERFLYLCFTGASTSGLGLYPYVNDYTPTPTSEESDFDNSGFPSSSPGWLYDVGDVTITTGDAIATASWPDHVFPVDSACVVYGYYIKEADTDVLLWAERFAEPQMFGALGGDLTITPLIRFGLCPC